MAVPADLAGWAEAIADAIGGDAFETYSPDMRPVVELRTSDPQGFLAGVADMARGSSAT